MTTANTAMSTTKPVEAELVTDDPKARVPVRISTPTQYRASLETWQKQGVNILTPATNFSGLPEGWSMMPTVVRLKPEIGEGDVYQDKLFCKNDSVALTKVALSKIAQAAGMSIKTHRTDDRSIPNYWEVQAAVRFVGLDGSVQELTATQEWDLRQGSARSASMSAVELKRSALNGLRSCEARAINAAIRLFGIKQTYSPEEVRQPFMCVRLMYEPDRTDPEIRKMLAERAMAGTSALFSLPAASRAAEPELLDTIGADLEERNAPGNESQADALPEGYGLISKLPELKKITKRSGGTFDKWFIVDHRGVVTTTTKKEFADSVTRCFENKTPVEIIAAEENEYGDCVITEINPLGSAKQSKLPDPNTL